VSRSRLEQQRKIVFVTPCPAGESQRAARAVGQLDNVVLLGIAEQLPEPGVADFFSELAIVDDSHDSTQLIDATHRLAIRWGPVDRIVSVHESLLLPIARASETLGLPGMSESTVLRTLDKSKLKEVLRAAALDTARDQVVMSALDARRFAAEVGFPLVLKPLTGSGGLLTCRVDTDQQLKRAVDRLKPVPGDAVLVEEHLSGEELCFDTVTINGAPQFYSVCVYRPTILEALDNPRVQWRCLMPRDISVGRYRDFILQGLAAVRALEVGNAMTHLEGFLVEGRVRFTDATLRPAGARIAPMLAFGYDIDPYRVWARVAVDGCFDGPWERKYAVGTVFLRGIGLGVVTRVDGVHEIRQTVGEWLVDSRLPRLGSPRSHSYTGDGFVTVRHPETEVVEDYLDYIAKTVLITYSHHDLDSGDDGLAPRRLPWERPEFDRQQCRPAWDDDSLPRVDSM
jgi:hypothetical protein